MVFRWLASALAAFMFTVVAIGAGDAYAQRGDLVLMADSEADLSGDTVTINTSRVQGSFGALRIYNRGSDILIDSVKVHYADGSVHNEDRKIDLRRGERTREIDPGRDNKFVDKVVVTYKKVDGSRRSARLLVYGVQDNRAAREKRPQSKVAAPEKPKSAPAKPSAAPPAAAAPAAPSAPPEVEKVPIKTTKALSETRCVGEGSLLLRRANVGFGNDRDRLKIGGQTGKFDKIRLCVFGHDIDLIDIKVSFAKGDPIALPYAGPIPAGHRTQAMSLQGDHFIDTIDITYKKREGVTAFANVEIWGEVSEKWIDEESELFNDGWVRLTTGLTAGFVGFDTERSPVRPHKKGFRKFRVVTKDRDITLDYVELFFADGTSQKFPANRAKVEPNVGWGPADINGGPKIVKEVEARYRSRFFDKEAKGTDRATVEIWAKR
ncbi:MAG: hypothetical protein H6876_07080 [Hyphomicrobiaceae bacterium]|nr:hypothetical protein [Hyphomicrobiaceae bacterium]MCC0007872.1 hypothetical protein [Hyphomicrobiaceae bacterium]